MYWERLLHFFKRVCLNWLKYTWVNVRLIGTRALVKNRFCKEREKPQLVVRQDKLLWFPHNSASRAVPLSMSQPKKNNARFTYIKSLHHSRTCYNNFECFINIIIIICIQRSIKYMNKTIYINFYTHKSHGIRVIGRDEIINKMTTYMWVKQLFYILHKRSNLLV